MITPLYIKPIELVHRVLAKEVPSSAIDAYLSENIVRLDFPEIYATNGDEMNTVHRDWEAAPLRICLVSGMTYHGSVGNLAIPLLYASLTENTDWYVDRCYLWESRKNFKLMTEAGLPPFGLQSHRSLAEYDVLAFSCSYLQTELHVGLMLKHAGIPWRHLEREIHHPFVLVGGHHMYVNPEPISHIPDAVWIGEFGAGGLQMLRDYKTSQEAGIDRNAWIASYATLDSNATEPRPGFYVPWTFNVEYSKEPPYPIREVIPNPGAPSHVCKAYVTNLDQDAVVNEHPLVPFINPSMGTAEIQTSLGCDTSTCTFCSEGQTNKPYRFMSVSRIVHSLKEQLRWSGMQSVTLSAFDGAGHPQKRHLIRELLEKVSDEVSLLSLRVDEMANDPLFATISTVAGNKTLSLGVEGMSERMRRVYNKHCTEKDLLTVVDRALASGATKIKFFLISSHPWETSEDRLEWAGVLERIEQMKAEHGSKATILSSWTPLVIMPWTALQWEAPTVDVKSLGDIIAAIKARTKTDFRIGSGGRKDEAYMAQLLQLGDRRLNGLVDWLIEQDFVHYGSTSKGFRDKIALQLAAIPGYDQPLGFHTWFRQKPYSETLPWDHLHVGVSREWLVLVNEASKNGKEITRCADACSKCGACSILDQIKMRSGHALQDATYQLHEVAVIHQRGTVQKARLKMFIDHSHRFIGDEYWLAGVRRAFYLSNLPIDKTRVTSVTQRYKFGDATYGTTYIDVGLISRLRPSEIKAISEHLPAGLNLLDVRTYSPKVGLFNRTVGSIHFVVAPNFVFSQGEIRTALEHMLGADQFLATIKEKNFRKGVVSVERDVRPWIVDAWLTKDGELHLMTKGTINPFELLPAMFKCSRRKIAGLDVRREDCYLADPDTDQIDVFRPVCSITGKKVEATLFDEVSSKGISVSAQYEQVSLVLRRQGTVVVSNIEPGELEAENDLAEELDLLLDQMVEELALVPPGA